HGRAAPHPRRQLRGTLIYRARHTCRGTDRAPTRWPGQIESGSLAAVRREFAAENCRLGVRAPGTRRNALAREFHVASLRRLPSSSYSFTLSIAFWQTRAVDPNASFAASSFRVV